MKNWNLALKSSKAVNGIAALPTMLLLGGIIVEISIVGAFISYLFSQSSFGIRLSEEALSLAQSGIQDALIKIIRNRSTITSGGTYTLIIENNKKVDIIICKDSKTASSNCDTSNNGKDEITSLGSVLTKKRKLRAIVNINSNTADLFSSLLKFTADFPLFMITGITAFY